MSSMVSIEAKVVRRLKGRRPLASILEAFGDAYPEVVAEVVKAWPDWAAVMNVMHAHRADPPDPRATALEFARQMGRHGMPDPLHQWVVYRIYGHAGQLLYVGKTGDGSSRVRNHLRKKPWAADIARVEYLECATEESCLAVERYLIEQLVPLHNVQHNRHGFTVVSDQAG